MQVITVRNVQQALVEGCYRMKEYGIDSESRNGKVKVLEGTTITEYTHPCERVLMDPDRDANPFFHFFESLWMLSGRRDVLYPSHFNSGFPQFSDDGVNFNAAYGYRWRRHFGRDQLDPIADALRANPGCRRQVLGIWDATHDLGLDSKDIPCNLTVTFQIGIRGNLDMVVFNRSNDLIWGAYGANAVHFSFLLEYMAAKIGVGVGTYTQVSANTHIYESHWELMNKLRDKSPGLTPYNDSYSKGQVPFRLVAWDVHSWEVQLGQFMDYGVNFTYSDPFFETVAKPLLQAWTEFKQKMDPNRIQNAREYADKCAATDWASACLDWLGRRAK